MNLQFSKHSKLWYIYTSLRPKDTETGPGIAKALLFTMSYRPDVRVIFNGFMVVKDELSGQTVDIHRSCRNGHQHAAVKPPLRSFRHFY